MKLITNSHLTYQRVLGLFTRWINEVKSTDEISVQGARGLSLGTSQVYLGNNHPLGEFDIIFLQESIYEVEYFNSACGAVITLLAAEKNDARWDSMDPNHEKDAQYIDLSISPGYLLPKEKSEHRETAFVAAELFEISYVFNQTLCARTIRVNGMIVEDFNGVNRLLVSPAVLAFIDFIVSVIEENQDYDRFVNHHPSHSDIWMKNRHSLTSEV